MCCFSCPAEKFYPGQVISEKDLGLSLLDPSMYILLTIIYWSNVVSLAFCVNQFLSLKGCNAPSSYFNNFTNYFTVTCIKKEKKKTTQILLKCLESLTLISSLLNRTSFFNEICQSSSNYRIIRLAARNLLNL